jgi:uncharacterized spore protein YtfJ
MAVEDTIRTTIDELQKVLSAKNITGEPIEMEDKIVLPITKMGMGFGTGSSQGGNNRNSEGASGGAGGGIGVFPVAVVIVFKNVAGPEGVKVIPLGTPSALSESLGEVVSAIMEWFSAKKESSEKKHDNPHAKVVEVK